MASGKTNYKLAAIRHGIPTPGGLTASDITQNKEGKNVSKKKSAEGKKNAWARGVKKAREELGIKGFVKIGDKGGEEGRKLHARALEHKEHLKGGQKPSKLSDFHDKHASPKSNSKRITKNKKEIEENTKEIKKLKKKTRSFSKTARTKNNYKEQKEDED